MDLIVRIDAVCPSGNHLNLTVTNAATGEARKMQILQSDLQAEPTDWESEVKVLLRSRIKESLLVKSSDIQSTINGARLKL